MLGDEEEAAKLRWVVRTRSARFFVLMSLKRWVRAAQGGVARPNPTSYLYDAYHSNSLGEYYTYTRTYSIYLHVQNPRLELFLYTIFPHAGECRWRTWMCQT
jgi:hypothetical protein